MGTYDQAIQQLYVAYFNRPADPAGLNYWNTVVTANKGSTTAVSAAFAGSAEYKAAYAGLNSTQIVDRVYQNLFGRAAEPSGLAYWALALDQKNTTIDNVVTIIATAAQGTDATAYKNKVTAATSFTTALDTNAEIVGYTGDAALGIAKTYISSVTDDASLAKAIATDALNQTVFAATAGALTVGTLTNGVDNLVAHTFNAPQVYTPGGNNFINSLQNDDKLTGTDASDDVLNVTLGNPNDNGQAEILPTLSKIETINAKFDATSNSMVLDLQDSTGVKAINITRIADGKNATVKNITEAATNNLSVANTQSPAGTVTFNYLTSAVAGATDTVNVTASNINVANLTVQSADGTKGFETFNLTSTGSANTIKQLTAQDVQTLKISGDTNLTLGAASNTTGGVNNQPEATRYAAGLSNVAGSLKAVDASALKGALDITIGTEINAGLDNTSGVNINETITGGSGNDIFRLATGASIDAADSIIGGAAAGTDTNTLVLLGNNTVAGTVSKVQALEIRTGHDAGVVADVVNVDASKITDLATTYIRNEGQQNTGTWTSASEGATVNLIKLTAAQDTAITIAHGTTGNSALANLTVSLSLATATGTTDKAAVTLVDGVNTDPVFNFNLVTPATEQLSITDNDTESNSVYLSGVSSYAGAGSSITLVDGSRANTATANGYFNLDTFSGNSAAVSANGANTATGRGGYGYATDGSAGSNTTALASTSRDSTVSTVFNVIAATANDRIVAENFDGSKYVGDIIARFGDITRADGASSQSIVGGTGNDTFIFDNPASENAGFTSADTVKGGTGTDTLIIDGDTSLLAGTPRITTNTSEWDNTTGIDVLRFAKNEGVANVGNGAVVGVNGGGYYAHIDNDFVSQTDAGNRLTVINNDGDRTVNSESDLVLDLTGLSQSKSVTYIGANGNGGANHASTRIIVDDVSANPNMILDGGDTDTSNATGNNNLLQVNNSANISIADLAQTKNFGRISFTNNTATTQVSQLSLNDTIVDALVDGGQSASALNVERLIVNGIDSTSQAAATVGLSISAGSLTAKSALDVTLGRGTNLVSSGAGADRVVLLGNYIAGTYNAIENGVSVNQQSTAGAAARVVTDTINLGGGNDTLVTYGAINLAGATLAGIENITNNSAVVITASQYAALIAARAALSLSGPVLTFSGAGPHQLTIVDDVPGLNNIDLSYISVTSGTLLYDTTSSSNATGGGTNNITTSNAISVSGSGAAIAGTVGTTPTNGGGAVAVTAGGTFNGTSGSNELFMSSIPGLNATTIAGNAADTDSLTLTTAGTVTLNNGSTGGTLSNLKVLNLANGTNTITYNTSAGFTTINGGSGDDTFIPNTALLPIVVNGGLGTDTIVLSAVYAATASGSGTFASNVTGFEKLSLTGVTNQTIDLQVLGNYSDVTFSGANGLTLSNLPSNGNITLNGAGTAFTISNAAFAGGVNDIVNLTLTDGSTSAVAFANTGITASGVETVNISVNDTQATPTGAFNDNMTWLGNSVKTFNVSGNAGLTLSSSSTSLTTVDASGITLGGFTWTASALTGTATVKGSATGTNTVNMNSATAGVNYTGGSGNDNVTINATVSSTASLGNGNNSLALNGVTILGTYTAGSGTDSLAFFSSTPDISNATITGFENLTLTNNANITATIAQMSQFTGTVNAAGTETLNLTTAGTFNAFSTIEKYNLANGTNNFTSANVAVSVIGGTGADTFNFTANQIVNFLTTVDGGNSTDTLNIGATTTQNIDLSTKVANIEIINVAGSIGTASLTNVDGAGVTLNYTKSTGDNTITLGSGGQTLNLLGTSSAATTVTGGAAVDTINLPTAGAGSETLIETGANMSNNTQVDLVGNFNATGVDFFKTGVNAAAVGSYIIGNATTANYLTTIASGLSIVLNNTGQAYLITIQTGSAAGTYLFQNTGSDTSQFDTTDFFVQLTGTVGSIGSGNLIA